MNKTLHGIIRGNTIEISETLDVPEGQAVEIQITRVDESPAWGAGIRASTGALVDDVDWDRIMQEVHENRQLERRVQVDEIRPTYLTL